MSAEAAVQTLQRSPDLFEHLARLNQFAENEQRQRERFTEELDEDVKAEFINGQVVVHSPVRLSHLNASLLMTNLLNNFVVPRGRGIIAAVECFVRCTRNDYEPDVCFFTQAKCARWEPSMKIFSPPDLVVEILSPSTARNDRTIKRQDYARHEVAEYWIVDADARTVEQHTQPGRAGYKTKALLTGNNPLTGVAVPGFTVPVAAFFDARENQRALRELLGQF